ncbi:hypothetical protein RAB80_010742 [Fusarium oxysporum f. sp. vasinfectum]|uniref:Uncharacterized protein n=1 Tax=Fusarium oxysporum f. sp. vasinfectum 25433 TaxID=1089449 RepID=X0MP91_FUSOX|nr:hypothetical protein FOTG_01906 [Fusarium oxysporum f. sp. vasinfectum 25433]KAK2673199.1 hypothetical protein RAB80_010742 [Fusarium oxysporum f. sp. vasinfectum]KAK2697855.1 hypothetical protein QWA68_002938 [Fusarium oxysporum]KAK2929617.1 hypothetical protein FoTM2_009957 [Fusarium oxysporum f. sp. vasinfectum]
MCFVFADPDLIIDEPELQSANLNMDKKGDTLSENEASLVLQRHEPRDFKDLTGHTFSTKPLDFKPVLTIPWTERPDQGVSNLAADLTIIEKFTTATQSEQPITTSIPRRLTPGTEIEIVTIIDGTKFIAPSSTSDATTTSQESEITSPKETTTDVPSLSTEKPLLTSSPNKSGEESSWTTSYTTSSSTELRPSSPANPSGAPIRSDTSAIVAGAIMENQESPTSHGTDLSSKNHHDDCRELVDLTGSVYSTIPSGFKPVLTFASEDLPGKDREDVTVIDKVDGTSTKNGVVVIGTETWEPFTWYTRHKHQTFTLVLRPTETTSSDVDILSIISHLTLPDATPTTSSEELTSSSSTSESLVIPIAAEPSNGSLSAGGWIFVLVAAVVLLFLSTMATMFIILRSRSRHNQDNFNIQLDNAPFEHTYTEPAQPVQPAPAIWKS